MNTNIKISASIVLYNENIKDLEKTILSFLKTTFQKQLFLIDNSPSNNFSLNQILINKEVVYIKNDKNLGFGKAHNLILDKTDSNYHLILNPDIEFNSKIFIDLISELENNQYLSMISPEVLYPNGKLQYTCRQNPTIREMVSRRVGFNKKYVDKRQYLNKNLSNPFYPEFIHGCFMLFKTDDFIKLNGFDERYFLYMEDADICRKIKESGKEILYYPKVNITHIHRKGSAKKIKLLFYHISSAIKYFRKWGFS